MHGGLGLQVSVAGHAGVDAGRAVLGVVDGEGGRGLVGAAHQDVGASGQDLLPAGVIPVNVFSVSRD